MKSLRIEKKRSDRDGFILRIGGKFTVEDSMYLRDYLDNALEGDVKILILDCEELEQINSAAIGVFVGIKMKMSEKNGRMGLASLKPVILDVLKLTNVDLILPIYETVEDALKQIQEEKGGSASSRNN